MPEWVINAGVLVAGMGVAFGALKSTIAELREALNDIKKTTKDTSERLVALETRLEAMDAQKLDERLRALEMTVARLGVNGAT